jgi:hypothetical protein
MITSGNFANVKEAIALYYDLKKKPESKLLLMTKFTSKTWSIRRMEQHKSLSKMTKKDEQLFSMIKQGWIPI